VVSNWIIRVYTILVWNTISGSSNLDICCYHCLILTLIFHLKVLINFFLFFFTIIIIVVVVLLLSIIYTINLLVVRPRSYRFIYYFDTPALGRRHQSFGRVKRQHHFPSKRRINIRLGLKFYYNLKTKRATTSPSVHKIIGQCIKPSVFFSSLLTADKDLELINFIFILLVTTQYLFGFN
jgi:hypothetical protein